jgi:hypothetical protein
MHSLVNQNRGLGCGDLAAISECAVVTRGDQRDKHIRRGTAGSLRQHTAGELILQVSLVVAIAPPAPPCDIGVCFGPLGSARMGGKVDQRPIFLHVWRFRRRSINTTKIADLA